MKTGLTVSDKLRAALQSHDASYRTIGKATGIDHSQLCRFAKGQRGLSTEAVDAVAEYLGLELRRVKPNKRAR